MFILIYPTQIVSPFISHSFILTQRVLTFINVHIYHLPSLGLIWFLVWLSLVHLVDWVMFGKLTGMFLIDGVMPRLNFFLLSWVMRFAPLSGMIFVLKTGNNLWLVIEELLNLLLVLWLRMLSCLWRIPFELFNFILLDRLHFL